jgi:hypothetical protein
MIGWKRKRNVLFSKTQFPPGAVPIRNEQEIDFLAGTLTAPAIEEEGDVVDTLKQQEALYKAKLKSLWDEVLAFRLNCVRILPVEILALKLPSIFGIPCFNWEDLKKTHTPAERNALEATREAVNLKMSVVTSTSNNLESFLGWIQS